MNNTLIRARLASAAAALALAGCGGGGGGAAPPPDPFAPGSDVPLAATQTATEATRFVRSASGGNSESADPLRLGDAALATSETAEPEPI